MRMIFVNLPVKDVAASRRFFEALGFVANEQFSGPSSAAMVIEENISVMLLVEPFFQSFTKLPVSDARQSTEVLLALQCDSRAEVDAVVARAVQAGATTPNAAQDMGFMYQHGFADLDGHQWEVFWMDEAAAPQQF